MKYVLVTVGKFKAPFIVEGMGLYRRRITRYTEYSSSRSRRRKSAKGATRP